MVHSSSCISLELGTERDADAARADADGSKWQANDDQPLRAGRDVNRPGRAAELDRSEALAGELFHVKQFKLTPPEPTEGQLHATVAEFLDWALMPPAVYTTFPAGWGVLTRATAGRLKGAGLKQGMPDLLVFCAGKTLGIELKSYKGVLTPVQIVMHDKLEGAGIHVVVCSTLDQVIAALRNANIPLRRTRGASDVA